VTPEQERHLAIASRSRAVELRPSSGSVRIKRDPMSRHVFEIYVLGPFSVFAADGIPRTPKGRKAQAIIAMLALSDRGERGRRWLQDKLWSDRGEAQGAASLRQTLTEIRHALGPEGAELFNTSGDRVRLDLARVGVDVRQFFEESTPERRGAMPDLLEGLDVRDPEFEEWLRAERATWQTRLAKLPLGDVPARVGIPASKATPALDADRGCVPLRAALCIGILPAVAPDTDSSLTIAGDMLVDLIAGAIQEFVPVDIADYRVPAPMSPTEGNDGTSRPDLLLQSKLLSSADQVRATVAAIRITDRTAIWSQSVTLDRSELLIQDGECISAFVNLCAEAILAALVRNMTLIDESHHLAAKMAIAAVHRMLPLPVGDIDSIDQEFTAIQNIRPSGLILACQCYLNNYRVGERQSLRDVAFLERTRHLARAAITAEPHNALVLALVAHAHSFILREFSYAQDLVTRAIELNPAQPLCWDTASLLCSYTARPEDAWRFAQRSLRLGRHSPHRNLFESACCIAAAASGRYAESVRHANVVLAAHPGFAGVLRYAAASYGHLGQTGQATVLMRRLIDVEPNFSVKLVRDPGYPVPSSSMATIIEQGLSKAGIPQRPAG
jgi:hypothetical protein